MVHKKYYTIVARKLNEVDPKWKLAHVGTFIVSFVSGCISAYCLGSGENGYTLHHCIINAKIVFDDKAKLVSKDNVTYPYPTIDLMRTDWGYTRECYFPLFSIIIASLVAFIMATFFVINPRGGRGAPEYGLSPPWQIVFPSLVVTLGIMILIYVVIAQLFNSIDRFCKQFEPVFETEKCTEKMDVYTLLYHNKKVTQYLYLKIAKYAFGALVVSWTTQFIILFSRILTGGDFNVVITTIKSKKMQIDEEKEEMHIKTHERTDKPEEEEHMV